MAELSCPLPSVDEALEEVAHWARMGLYCHRDPVRPHIRLRGDPDWSHPVIGRAIAAMGGWGAWCLDESLPGVQRKQFRDCYEAARESWLGEARKELHLPAAQRSRSVFPPYMPFREVQAQFQFPALPPAEPMEPAGDGPRIPMPAHIRARLGRTTLGQAIVTNAADEADEEGR